MSDETWRSDFEQFQTSIPDVALPDVVVPDQDDQKYWMQLSENVWTRPVFFNISQGSWANVTRAQGTGVVSRHRHPAPVTGYTLDGAWYYPEHDWVARRGTFVFEPAGDVHTLTVHPSEGHFTCLFHNFGPVIYVDEEGRHTGFEDVFVRLGRYKAHCARVGIPESYIESMIR